MTMRSSSSSSEGQNGYVCESSSKASWSATLLGDAAKGPSWESYTGQYNEPAGSARACVCVCVCAFCAAPVSKCMRVKNVERDKARAGASRQYASRYHMYVEEEEAHECLLLRGVVQYLENGT